MSKTLKLYLLIIYILALIIALVFAINYSHGFNFVEVAFFTVSLLLLKNSSMLFNSISNVFTAMILPVLMTTFVYLNPFWVGIIAAIGTIEFKFRKTGFIWYKFLFNRCVFFLSGGIGALVFKISSNYFGGNRFPFLALFLASLIYFVVDNLLVYIVLRIAEDDLNNTSLFTYFQELSKNLVTSYFLGLILFASYKYFGYVFFSLVIILLFIIKDFFYSRIQQLNSYTQIIESFLKVIDSKDHYTEGHCKRVAYYTYHLAKKLGLSRAKTEKIVNVAKIHDIGKIYVDDDILTSGEQLSNSEYKEIQRHAEYGYKLLKDIDILKEELKVILHHHERWDGYGYPEGLKGEEIPVGARVLNITDSFDVMTTGRRYKPALNKYETIQELKDCSGTQFDPEMASKMIELIDEGFFDNSFQSEEMLNEYEFSIEY